MIFLIRPKLKSEDGSFTIKSKIVTETEMIASGQISVSEPSP